MSWSGFRGQPANRWHNGSYESKAAEHRARIGSAIGLMCVLSFLLLEGCYSTPRPPGIHFPITRGSHTVLPRARQRILIWGDSLSARMADTWLRSHHYSSILIPSQNTRSSDRQRAFETAAEQNAEFVLILEQEALKEGALIQSSCGALFNITVNVQGLLVENQETTLRGSAQYPHCVELNDQTVQNLTCQALATAWGFRPSGQLDIPSHLACTAGQSTSAPNH